MLVGRRVRLESYVQLREEGVFGGCQARWQDEVGWNLCRWLLFARFNHLNCGGRHATG